MHEKTISRKTVYEGIILNIELLDVEMESGRKAKREIVKHGAAVAIVPRLPDGRFVFVRQFRKPVERICFEVVAGNCDEGESSEESALRELKEETGYSAQFMEKLGSIFPSVGYCTERIDIFYAEVASSGSTSFDEDERIETVVVSEDEMNGMIRDGKIQDAKTLSAWMLYRSRKAGI